MPLVSIFKLIIQLTPNKIVVMLLKIVLLKVIESNNEEIPKTFILWGIVPTMQTSGCSRAPSAWPLAGEPLPVGYAT